jgi:protein-S-isoprenylcysteine O-methyltransferase Ste14
MTPSPAGRAEGAVPLSGAGHADTEPAPLGSPRGRVGARSTERRLTLITTDPADAFARVVIGGLFLGLAYRIGLDAWETGRLTGLLLLTLVRRGATRVDRRLKVRVIATVSIVGPFLLRPDAAAGLLGETITLGLSAAGLAVVVAGKISLGRSFGLLPAHRGIVSTGVYRLIRHPIYLGYVVTHGAFLAANATMWNLSALVTADLALLLRTRFEEQTLTRDVGYRRYQHAVRWRLVPEVY